MIDNSDAVVNGDIDHRLGASGVPDLNAEQQTRIKSLRESARLFARHIARSCPNSFEREQAILEIDSAASWAAKAIARHE